MTEQHPITPPLELVQEWHAEAMKGFRTNTIYEQDIATQAARWGADMELEACCALALTDPCCGTKFQRSNLVQNIRNRRRPKPPSLKEQSLAALRHILNHSSTELGADTIRRALEQLDE